MSNPGDVFAPLSYPAPSLDNPRVTHRTIDLMRQTALWVRIVSIFLMIGLILMVIASIAMIAVGIITGTRRGAEPIAMGLVYFAMSCLYIAPTVYLSRFASLAKSFSYLRNEQTLEQAIETQKSFWKFCAILMIVMLCFYIILFGLAAVLFMLRF